VIIVLATAAALSTPSVRRLGGDAPVDPA
jgi:hypothetical protein